MKMIVFDEYYDVVIDDVDNDEDEYDVVVDDDNDDEWALLKLLIIIMRI
jgi:hypothetical protein